ncbi:unnamed protein product [Moneuplotes crassus]|uniref:Dystroglycan-type cadherin-like domain-containing protein n=1 Tax=Euplotes crassus TaxID=5936 RepID=A0AAD1ULP6_EUPCR|nr:unnamed protein product [Moneuplotes crassus]
MLLYTKAGECDDAYQFTPLSGSSFVGYQCCIGNVEMFYFKKTVSSSTVKISTIVVLKNKYQPYNTSEQFSKEVTSNEANSVFGFSPLDSYVDTGYSRFIISGQYISNNVYYYGFLIVTPGDPPTFKLKFINQKMNDHTSSTTRSFTQSRLIKPSANLGYFGVFVNYYGHISGTNETQLLLKVQSSTLQVSQIGYITGHYDGSYLITNSPVPMMVLGTVALSDNTVTILSYITNQASSEKFSSSYRLSIGSFTNNAKTLRIWGGSFQFSGMEPVNTTSGERIIIYGSAYNYDYNSYYLYYSLLHPGASDVNQVVRYSKSGANWVNVVLSFQQKSINEVVFVFIDTYTRVVIMNLDSGQISYNARTTVNLGDIVVSSYAGEIYLHKAYSSPYVISKYSTTLHKSCSEDFTDESTWYANLGSKTSFEHTIRALEINSASTSSYTLQEVALSINDATVSAYQESDCGSSTGSIPDPIKKETAKCGSGTTSWYFDSLVKQSFTTSCTLKSWQTMPTSIYYDLTVYDSSNLAIPWMSLTSWNELIATDIPCSLIGNITLYLKADIGQIGNQTVKINLEVKPPTPLINDTVQNQGTTALNSAVTYSVSTMFKNPDGYSSVLTYSATLSDGSMLPSWIDFDPTTKIFTFATTSVNTAAIKLICTNKDGGSQNQQFTASITNTSPTVISSMGSVTREDNTTFTDTFNLTQVFQEVDPNQSLTFSIDNDPAPPSFVTASISADHILTVTGKASSSDIGGIHRVFVEASDSFNVIFDILTIIITENNPPAQPAGFQTSIIGYEDTQNNTDFLPFTDEEGNPISYVVTNSNGSSLNTSWITFDPVGRKLVYTPYGSLTSPIAFTFTASDAFNTPVDVTVTMTIKFKPKDNPAVVTRQGEFVVLSYSYFEVPESIITDDAAITSYWVTLDDGTSPPPSWLTILDPLSSSSGNFEFSGIYPVFVSETISLRIYARDSDNLEGYSSISIQTKLFCHVSCLTCNGPDIDDCLTCDSGRFLYLTLCKLVCPDGYYGDSSSNTCQPCNTVCSKCNGATELDCIECTYNSTHKYFRHNNECLNHCPLKMYGDPTLSKCENCHSFCTNCYGELSTQCTACDIENRYTLVAPDTCIYLECPDGFYYNNVTKDCQPCHETCQTCNGPNSTNCVSCSYSKFLNQQLGSCQLCSEINSGLVFEALTNTCLEQCGKGYNLGFVECDDGNSSNDDGCSANCEVETDWKCEGGNSTNPDTCFSLIGPTVEFTFINRNSYLGSFALIENVTFGDYSEGDISVSIDGPLSPYEFNFTMNDKTEYIAGQINSRFKIQFEFLSSLAGDHQETITVTFNKPELFIDSDGNALSNTNTSLTIPFFKSVVSDEEKAAASAQSSASLLSLILALGSSTFISVVLGGTIEATWLLFGCIQLMSFVPLFNMNLPGNFREFSKNLAVLHGEPAGLPNLFEYFVDTEGLEPFNNYFEIMGFKTELIVMNSGRKIELWIIMFLSMGISFLLYDLFAESKIGKIVRMVDTKIRYGLLIRSVSQFYLSFFLCSVLNIYKISWSGVNVDYFNNACALIAMFTVLYIPIKSFNIVYKAGDLNSEEFKKRYKTIIAGLKISGPLCFQFISLFYFRRGVYASIFVLFNSVPIFQIGSASVVMLSMALYIIIVRPYDSILSNFLSVINEFLVTSMIGGCYRFVEPAITPSLSSLIGNIFIGIVISTIVINWVSIICYGIGILIKNKIRKGKLKSVMKAKDAIFNDSSRVFAKLSKNTT